MKIHLRQISVQVIASILVIGACRQFAMLHDTELLNAVYSQKGLEGIHGHIGETTGERFYAFVRFTYLLLRLGVVLTFIASLLINRLKKGYWANPAIVGVVMLSLVFVRFFDFQIVRSILILPSWAFMRLPLEWVYLLNACLLVILGSGLFYLSLRLKKG